MTLSELWGDKRKGRMGIEGKRKRQGQEIKFMPSDVTRLTRGDLPSVHGRCRLHFDVN